ncbi:hypothetical protein Nos7524_2707 [Nostoc sp. PCC 7524]|jgi:hypothetical protein|uniref:hypothetical protein n=1 Tax=Nostoc sp. (strain ATCC 29411 / PCC 7524) TaxID=28072 RepID=UPI00029EC947|nr:hypothetical protein [Nostoc sp. PCC 7524]AFY48540.1 hypothetical protein Nos7524_2707 [Nostoc sp. PCC 7524]
MNKTTQNKFNSEMTDEDWLNLGKADAWAGKPKASPEQDAQAASMYDLGYSEGEITRSPIEAKKADSSLKRLN